MSTVLSRETIRFASPVDLQSSPRGLKHKAPQDGFDACEPAPLRDITNQAAAFRSPAKKARLGNAAPPAYYSAVLLESNHRIGSAGTKQSVEIVDPRDAANADRIQVEEGWLEHSSACLGMERGTPTLALSSIEPDQIMALPRSDLKVFVASLAKTHMRIRWWDKNGKLATQRIFKNDTRGVSAATALFLLMRARGNDVAAFRILALSPDSVAHDLARIEARDFIGAGNITAIVTDSVIHIADPESDGAERLLARAASNAVADHLRASRAARNPAELTRALRALIADSRNFERPDAAGAYYGIVVSGLFKYIESLENDERRVVNAARMGVSIGLACLEEAPGGKIASTILSLAMDFGTEALMKKTYASTREAARAFVLDEIKFPMEKHGLLPSAEKDAQPYDEAARGRFSRWLALALEANNFGI